MKINNRGNASLIGLLAAALIIGVMAYLYFGKGSGVTTVKSDSKLIDQASKKQTVLGKSMDTSKGVDCRERLNQIRTGIQTYKASSTEEGNPKSLKDVGLGVSSDYFICPVSKQSYNYDPNTGTVTCPYPGHAGF